MEKINVAELLKDCPKGMELDCVLYDDVTLECVSNDNCYPIKIHTPEYNMLLSKYGCLSLGTHAKCVIFPKDKTTWKGFQRPFVDGDVICYLDSIAIFKEWGDATLFRTYVTAYLHGDSTIDVAIPLFGKSIRRESRLATEEEKAKLFDAIKASGYKWNEETKTLEKLVKPKFEVGDRIRKKGENSTFTITDVNESHYFCGKYVICDTCDNNWELVPNKFDITTLKPYDKVLVRLTKDNAWNAAFFSHYDKEVKWGCYPFVTTSSKSYLMCIPYEGNEHLLGKTDDCSEFYKNW